MIHIMKLTEDSFNRLKNGTKVREYRLLDDKRKLIKKGDTIIFKKLPELVEEISVIVKDIEIFNNWYDCYSKYYRQDFKDRYNNVEEVVQDTYNTCYSEEESNKNKCVVFAIEKESE